MGIKAGGYTMKKFGVADSLVRDVIVVGSLDDTALAADMDAMVTKAPVVAAPAATGPAHAAALRAFF